MRGSAFEKRPFLEMAILVALMLTSALFVPIVKGIFVILTIAYVIAEQKIRKRDPADSGFNLSDLGTKLKRTWPWIVLVGVIFQAMYVIVYRSFIPGMFEHVLERAALIKTFDSKLILNLIVLAFGEELIFRGLVQGRLEWVMKPHYAIMLTSGIFALMHLSPGGPGIVALDLASIFLDSVIFGIIFAKTRSIYVSAIAHALANIAAAFLISVI
jgi:membrane protease YdiL (CAAX protease family)